ncbi:Eco57I restriction-modification methylase domain-containing protein [Bacteroides caecimuris]|uniref:Eco57I restriction-modification methylase domain-containing protein n=1 Tax=Bacteroides caecimuris TaxID=1796613 RepID=UPI0025897330|nr:Eco57I restriction-modification methylase domain-containing protein [Bacteroides caecimuris]
MEGAKAKIDTAILDNIIVGRVEPYIYAFSTETVPNYLKVGDTSRGVRVRLDEWRKIFPNLVQQYEHSAQIDDETIFRDFAVHTFLEREKGRVRLQQDTFADLPYYSREFFKEATTEDVNAAVSDIIQSAREKSGKYSLYSPDRLPQILTYERTEKYKPRYNQQQAIDNFKKAVEAGRTNLLLYAVMRFGKSFTSMCCAQKINARFVVIVSAKADVKEEWKKTVESHKDFEGYHYLDSEALKRNETVIADTLADPDKKVALFLTLQDLQGDDIKEKHKEVFDHQIDLLIIDETHFGARGESYGKVLQAQRLSKSEINKELKDLDGFETLDRVEDAVKALNAKIRLHLSGTPYRILMSDEFQKEDIIAFVQFTDIIDAQQQWNDEHLKDDKCDEWENPYYGFPQMIRFAFNPNESSRKKMEQLRKDGITYAFSELFRPLSMTTQTDGSHRQFKHEAEILDLLEVIDGTKEDENLLGFLDYNKIKEGKMCRHIVCVLPFRASCDAMSALIQRNRDKFKNLGNYEIINIAGFDDERKYKSTEDVKRIIKECENQNIKTLTLTVNRMLTGTTVPQWDTMLYLKGTASPQEYDQAIFRLQNQYITTFKDESGKTIKYNMKPQTLLVDFDPNRMFILQELKSQFYNVNTEMQGNAQLKERIAKELEVSPIIVLNKNKLQQATPTNITDAVREYSRTRSILDDASEIPADNDLLQDDTLAAILRTIEPIDAKNGLQIKPTEGKGDDIDVRDGGGTDNPKDDAAPNDNPAADPKPQTEPEDNDNLEKRLAAYYARILFFAFLTESTVKSLEDVIAQIPTTEDNRRIARNLGLNVGILKLIQSKSNPFVLRKFDYKIENTNDLVRDKSLQPIERVEVAMRKFGRLSDSEVVTPAKVADEMVSILPFEELDAKGDAKFLDIASKQGEFTIALYKKFGDKAKEYIYAIPTSALTYEFTRKAYKLLEMPVENVFADFTSYDLIGENNEKIIKKLTDMKFDAIIGNPPYQIAKEGTSDEPIYHLFYDAAFSLSEKVSLITPARYLFNVGKTPKEWNEKILNDTHFKVVWYNGNSSGIFPNVDIKGGIAVGYRDANKQFGGIHVYTTYPQLNTLVKKVSDYGYTPISKIFYAQNKFNLETLYAEYPDYRTRIGSNGRERRLTTSIFALTELFSEQQTDDDICVLGLIKNQRTYRYLKRKYIEENGNLDFYKVIVPKSNGSGAIGEVLSTPLIGEPLIGEPLIGYTQSFISFGKFETQEEADAAHKYIRSKFVRTLLGVLKVTQDNSKEVWRYVPLQDFTINSDIDWNKNIAEIDAQLYAKYGLSADEIAFIDSMVKPME